MVLNNLTGFARSGIPANADIVLPLHDRVFATD